MIIITNDYLEGISSIINICHLEINKRVFFVWHLKIIVIVKIEFNPGKPDLIFA